MSRISIIDSNDKMNKAYGSSGKLKNLLERIKYMTQKATTGSPLALIAILVSTAGILYGVAKDTVLVSSSQQVRLSVLEKFVETDVTNRKEQNQTNIEWQKEMLNSAKRSEQILRDTLYIQGQMIPYIKMPSFKRTELQNKIDKGLNGQLLEPYANGDTPAPGE